VAAAAAAEEEGFAGIETARLEAFVKGAERVVQGD
jgi:hypothetical protein